MLTETKQTPSRQDMQDLAKSLQAMQDGVWEFIRDLSAPRGNVDLQNLWIDLEAVYTTCARAAGMLETMLSHKEVDA